MAPASSSLPMALKTAIRFSRSGSGQALMGWIFTQVGLWDSLPIVVKSHRYAAVQLIPAQVQLDEGEQVSELWWDFSGQPVVREQELFTPPS